jgi:hypothetical protein
MRKRIMDDEEEDVVLDRIRVPASRDAQVPHSAAPASPLKKVREW